MEAFLFLADAANFSLSGGLNVLGGGFSVTGPSPLPRFSVLVIARFSPDEDMDSVELRVQLLRAETGAPVVLESGDQQQIIETSQRLEVPEQIRPAGIPPGFMFEMEVGQGLVLEPGLYEWRASLNGRDEDNWRAYFYVRATADEYPPEPRAMSLPRRTGIT